MNKFLLFILNFIFCFPIFSQSPLKLSEVARSKIIATKKAKEKISGSLVTKFKDDLYILKLSDYKKKLIDNFTKGKYNLLRLDSDLEIKKSKDLNIGFKEEEGYNRTVHYISLFEIFNNQIILGEIKKNRKKKKAEIFIHLINPETLEPLAKPKKVLEVDFKGTEKHEGDYGFSISSDKSKLLVYATRNLTKRYELVAKAFDENMELLWEKDFSDKYKLIDELPIKQALISNSGDGFLLLRTNKPEDKRLTRINKLTFDHAAIPDQKNKDLMIKFNKDQQLHLLGFYSDKGIKTNGVMISKVNTEKETLEIDNTYISLPEDFLELHARKVALINKKGHRDLMIIKETYEKENGNWIIVGHSPFTEGYDHTYYYRNITLAEITIDGKCIWNKKIPYLHKLKKYDNPRIRNIPYHFLLFPYAENTNLILPGKEPTIYSFNSKGQMNESNVYSEREYLITHLYPLLSKWIDNNLYLIVGEGKKKKRIIKMEIEN